MIICGAKVGLVIFENGAMHVDAFACPMDLVLHLIKSCRIARGRQFWDNAAHRAALDEIEGGLQRARQAIADEEARDAAPRFTVYAVKDDEGTTIRCEDDDPERQAFGLYACGEDTLPVWLSDHATRAEAEAAMPAGGILTSGGTADE